MCKFWKFCLLTEGSRAPWTVYRFGFIWELNHRFPEQPGCFTQTVQGAQSVNPSAAPSVLGAQHSLCMHFSILSFHEELFYLEFLVQFKSCKTHRTLCLEDLPWFWKLLRYFIINPQVILIPYVSSSLCNVCQYFQPAGWAAEGDSLAFLVGECQRQMEPLV